MFAYSESYLKSTLGGRTGCRNLTESTESLALMSIYNRVFRVLMERTPGSYCTVWVSAAVNCESGRLRTLRMVKSPNSAGKIYWSEPGAMFRMDHPYAGIETAVPLKAL